jgi:hypothetical protein
LSAERGNQPRESGGGHWALVATLIQTAKLNKLDPLAWLTDVFERTVSGQTKRNELHTLLPWNWKAAAHSADPDQPFRAIAITDSADPDHAVHDA